MNGTGKGQVHTERISTGDDTVGYISGHNQTLDNLLHRLENQNQRMWELCVRMLGSQTAKEKGDDAPEPVRSSLEQMKYLLDELDAAVSVNAARIDSLEQL